MTPKTAGKPKDFAALEATAAAAARSLVVNVLRAEHLPWRDSSQDSASAGSSGPFVEVALVDAPTQRAVPGLRFQTQRLHRREDTRPALEAAAAEAAAARLEVSRPATAARPITAASRPATGASGWAATGGRGGLGAMGSAVARAQATAEEARAAARAAAREG